MFRFSHIRVQNAIYFFFHFKLTIIKIKKIESFNIIDDTSTSEIKEEGMPQSVYFRFLMLVFAYI